MVHDRSRVSDVFLRDCAPTLRFKRRGRCIYYQQRSRKGNIKAIYIIRPLVNCEDFVRAQQSTYAVNSLGSGLQFRTRAYVLRGRETMPAVRIHRANGRRGLLSTS